MIPATAYDEVAAVLVDEAARLEREVDRLEREPEPTRDEATAS